MTACARCGEASPDGQRFCGHCGSRLADGSDIAQLIQERLDARLKDQRVIELETAQAIVARVGEWAKLFGYFVAVPLGLLVLVLTILGFRQYSDFVKTVESTRQDLSRQLEAIKSEFAGAAAAGKNARSEGDKLNQEIAEIRKTVDLTQAAKLRSELERLSARVSGIESRFKINSAGVSTALERSLTQSLSRFADYMENVGFDAKQAPTTVTINKPAAGQSPNTYYSLDEQTVVVDMAIGDLEGDPSMVLWPYAQHLMLLANKTAMTSVSLAAQALSSGVPDYSVRS